MRSLLLTLLLFVAATTAFAVMAATNYFPSHNVGPMPERIEYVISGAMLGLALALALRLLDES
jgi:hypothetical protein